MSTYLKILIPLLDPVLKKEDLSKESGFIDAYVFDKNRPYIEDSIFLMYDMSVKNKTSNEREYRMRSCKNISGKIIENIDGKSYKIYTFPLIGKDIKNVFKGLKPTGINNVHRVLGFWSGTDESVNMTMLNASVTKMYLDWKTIPEFDYRPLYFGGEDVLMAA